MSQPRITLVTSASMPNLYPGEAPLLDALRRRGTDPHIAVWNDPSVNWNEAGLCVVRSVVDYASDRDRFLEWVNTVPRILNHPDVLTWNSDKHYLNELERLGLSTIPTTWLEPSSNLSKHQVHSRFPAMEDFVVKPAVSSGARDIGRYSAADPQERQDAVILTMELLNAGRPVMLQRYLEDIDLHGELSLVFFNGILSHAVEKKGQLSPASTPEHTIREIKVVNYDYAENDWRWGESIRAVVHEYVRERMGRDEQILFNRVDLVPDGAGSYRVMEVSMVDADLYLSATPKAVTNFADAIAMRAFW